MLVRPRSGPACRYERAGLTTEKARACVDALATVDDVLVAHTMMTRLQLVPPDDWLDADGKGGEETDEVFSLAAKKGATTAASFVLFGAMPLVASARPRGSLSSTRVAAGFLRNCRGDGQTPLPPEISAGDESRPATGSTAARLFPGDTSRRVPVSRVVYIPAPVGTTRRSRRRSRRRPIACSSRRAS